MFERSNRQKMKYLQLHAGVRTLLALALIVLIGAMCLGSAAYAGTVSLPRTGQVMSYATGDDGALQKGVAWPDPRFTVNSDQTVTDILTGLVWTKDAGTPTMGSCTGGVKDLGINNLLISTLFGAVNKIVPFSMEFRSLKIYCFQFFIRNFNAYRI
ncbi:MAG: hypothetical protein SFH39_02915 [Candidatus Magnetobacterium sp. LHC-1]